MQPMSTLLHFSIVFLQNVSADPQFLHEPLRQSTLETVDNGLTGVQNRTDPQYLRTAANFLVVFFSECVSRPTVPA